MTKTQCTALSNVGTTDTSDLIIIFFAVDNHSIFSSLFPRVLSLKTCRFFLFRLVLATLKSLYFFVFRYEMMTLCWQFNPKARPTFVYLISLLEKDLSDTFHDISFYRTLTEDHLKGLLSSHYKHKNKSEKVDSSPSIDSSAEKKNVPVENYA